MKYFILCISIIIYSNPVLAQWMQQVSSTTQNLYDIEFLNENSGWAVGDAGVVIKTTNGGTNWIYVLNPAINKPLNQICPIDSNIVYFIGGHSTFLKTTNGGLSWLEIRNGPLGQGGGYAGIFFFNKDTGWVCGANKILRTYNGGISFDSFYTPAFSTCDIYFKDMNTGLICEEGEVYKTTNGGMNWFATNVPDGALLFFRKLTIAENQFAWVMGNNGTVFKTTNFGDTWALIDTIAIGGFIPIHFSSALTGWAGGTGNRLYKSTDGGFSWKREQTDTTSLAFIASIGFVNDSIGWYVGGVGKIYKTTTSGQTIVNISVNNIQLPEDFILNQNHPNPFNPSTNIRFDLVQSGYTRLSVYDISGKRISVLVDENLSPGSYEYNFNTENLPSGVYFYKIETESFTETKRMVLIK